MSSKEELSFVIVIDVSSFSPGHGIFPLLFCKMIQLGSWVPIVESTGSRTELESTEKEKEPPVAIDHRPPTEEDTLTLFQSEILFPIDCRQIWCSNVHGNWPLSDFKGVKSPYHRINIFSQSQTLNIKTPWCQMHVAEFLKMCCTVVQGPRAFPLTISGLAVLSPYFFRILLHCGRGCLSAGKSAHSQRVEEKMHSPGDDFL